MSTSSKYLAAREIYRRLLAKKGAKKEFGQIDSASVERTSESPNFDSLRSPGRAQSAIPDVSLSKASGGVDVDDVAPAGTKAQTLPEQSLGKHPREGAPNSEVQSRRVKHKSSRARSTAADELKDSENVKLVSFPPDTSVETHQELLCEVAEQLCF